MDVNERWELKDRGEKEEGGGGREVERRIRKK